ncbi:type VI secretion system-associated FHA domain protein TagH [Alteromonadaceae bacterium BrNp21-10]|nr:type VI secretion system-associated FHA domain protein TagH [Alteromonadaceae bacterium BrNp21-10]
MLTLQINSYQKSDTSQPASQTLTSGSMTIGRDISNQWSLADPDRVLSKSHCRIDASGDQYTLTDTSTNGVFINTATDPIGRGNSVPLKSGDTIRLSDYEIMVNIEAKQQTEAVPQTPVTAVPEAVNPQVMSASIPPAPSPNFTPPPPPPMAQPIVENDDWKNMLEPQSIPDDMGMPEQDAAVEVPDFAQTHYDAPSVGISIPDDWGMGDETPAVPPMAEVPSIPDIENVPSPPVSVPEPNVVPEQVQTLEMPAVPAPIEPVAPPPQPAAVAPSAPVAMASNNQLMQAFLQGAGLDANLQLQSDPTELMRELGSLFKASTMGLMGVLAARGDIKSEFRLSQTMIRPTENNPLKFSLNINEAMVALINKKGAGYMPAETAFEEAFDDIKAHQVAVLAGMQSALKSLLLKFDPALIRQRDEELKGVKKMLGGQKSKYWDEFVSLYNRLQREAEDDFQNIFGREFAKSYEQQIHNQKVNKS